MSSSKLLSLAFLERKPRAAAVLLQDFTPEQAVDFLQDVPATTLIPVVAYMASWPAARTLSSLPGRLAANILRGLPTAEAETLLRLMTGEQRSVILKHMPNSTAQSFTRKLDYPLSTVGAWMDTSVPCFTTDSSVADCLDLVKRQKSRLGGVVIVVDNKRHLVGVIEVEKLLTNDTEQKLVNLLNKDIQALASRATLWEVQDYDGWTKFPALPVTDHNNLMLGALTSSALRAGTAKTSDRPNDNLKFSLVTHMARAFLVVLTGLLQVMSGNPEIPGSSHQRPVRTTHKPAGDDS